MDDVSAAWAVKQYCVMNGDVDAGTMEGRAVVGTGESVSVLAAQREEELQRLSEAVSLQIGGYSRHGPGC